MNVKRPTTIEEYIRAAPAQGQPHLRKVYKILKRAAPTAREAIKWGNPFFIEPRFIFAFSAHKAHLSFAPGPESLEAFQTELTQFETTRNFLKIPYAKPVPEALIKKIASFRVKAVAQRADDNFW